MHVALPKLPLFPRADRKQTTPHGRKFQQSARAGRHDVVPIGPRAFSAALLGGPATERDLTFQQTACENVGDQNSERQIGSVIGVLMGLS
jgi:hypothetical protein